jgi:hypothetical protein
MTANDECMYVDTVHGLAVHECMHVRSQLGWLHPKSAYTWPARLAAKDECMYVHIVHCTTWLVIDCMHVRARLGWLHAMSACILLILSVAHFGFSTTTQHKFVDWTIKAPAPCIVT